MKYIRFLLFPFSAFYYLITSLRNLLFDKQVLKATSFPIPTLVVGNLSVGGTGKTPQIEYLVRLLSDVYKVAVLSRGYKRKTKGFLLATEDVSVEEVGDEPLQFFKKFKNIMVAVDEKRVHGIQELLKQHSPEIILLDDAFQHRALKASIYILLTSYADLFTNDFLLPVGNLRESRRGAKRADRIIVTKCPIDLSKNEQQEIAKKMNLLKNQSIFFTHISYSKRLKGKQHLDLKELVNYEVLLITGIANPIPLLEFLNEKKISYKHLQFSDHHYFSKAAIDKIRLEFDKIPSTKKLILTTEKDFVRLSNQLDGISYLEIEITFLNNEGAIFDQSILKQLP